MEEVAPCQVVPAIQESPQGSTEVLNLLHHGDFRPGTDAAASGSERPEPSATCPQATRAGGGIPGLPRCGSRRNHGTPLPAPPAGSSPETPPHERGCESYTINSLRSQYRSWFVVIESRAASRARLMSFDASPIALAPPKIAGAHDEAEVETVRPRNRDAAGARHGAARRGRQACGRWRAS
jgi:hypothetical protein